MKKPHFTDEAKYPVPYSPAAATDITKTFARERKRLAEQAEKEREVAEEARVKIRRMKC